MSRFRSRKTLLNTEFWSSWKYRRCFWSDFEYEVLTKHIMTRAKRGRGDHVPYSDVIIMADTETSKDRDTENMGVVYPEYYDIVGLLSGGVSISGEDSDNIPDFKAWKKENKDILRIHSDGVPVSWQYDELSGKYPYLFPAEITHPADQLLHIIDTLKEIQPEDIEIKDNHICLWTISLRALHYNIVTLYGFKPSEMIECISKLHEILPGDRTVIYFHNLAYDYVFLRKFMYEVWGLPDKQLATKSHYPIWIKFENEINFKDSLILSQRSLEKWGADLQIEHQKAVGFWDYDLIRDQDYQYSDDELTYAEYDTLAGVECLDKFMESINKDLTSIPYTSTGVLRHKTRVIGKAHRAHDQYSRICIDNVELYQKANRIYHGGYTHANRYVVEYLIKQSVKCFDFASSYPFVMLSEKYPMEKYIAMGGEYTAADVLKWYHQDYSVLFTIKLENVHLKDLKFPMPYIQQSKIIYCEAPILDNGRILDADVIIMELCELDLYLIDRYYTYENDYVTDVYLAEKDYLPRWFTDLIFKLYSDKCELKFGDPVLYSISKGLLNSCYGMCAQKNIMPDLTEDYQTGEYYEAEKTQEEITAEYNKHINKRTSILPYQWSLYVTGYATLNLFKLGECAGEWYYSDTDSVYGSDWNMDRLNKYNDTALDKLRANGYDILEIEGHTFQLGKAEPDGDYIEFKTMGAKRYAVRKENGEIKITVAGVPKKTGAACLNNSLNNLRKGFVFEGTKTGKKTHTFLYNDKIFIDKWGNEIGDSIDLSPCNYLLDSTLSFEWFFDEVLGSFEVEVYDEGAIT